MKIYKYDGYNKVQSWDLNYLMKNDKYISHEEVGHTIEYKYNNVDYYGNECLCLDVYFTSFEKCKEALIVELNERIAQINEDIKKVKNQEEV